MTDTSNVDLGAVLQQKSKLIAKISRVLRGAELNYSILEKEVLSIVWVVEKFEYLLLGQKFKIITDNQTLTEIKNKKEYGSKRIIRWLEKLSYYDYNIIYRPVHLNI